MGRPNRAVTHQKWGSRQLRGMKEPDNDEEAVMRTLVLTTITLGVAATVSSAQAGPSSPVPFHPERLSEHTSEYVMVVDGAERGTSRVMAVIVDSIVVFTQETRIKTPASEMIQQIEIRFAASDLGMISSSYSTHFGDTRLETTARYDETHVTGEVQVPGPSGITKTPIDTALDPGTIDAGAAWALIGTLDLTDGAEYTFLAFDPSGGAASRVEVRVAGHAEITVPAGTFDAWIVDMAGFGGTIRYHVERAPPHSILSVVPVGQPQTLELVSRW